MSAELTPWFDGQVKPTLVGVYERQIPGGNGTAFWFWNSRYWEYGGAQTANRACKGNGRSYDQDLPWRGLASDPAVRP